MIVTARELLTGVENVTGKQRLKKRVFNNRDNNPLKTADCLVTDLIVLYNFILQRNSVRTVSNY